MATDPGSLAIGYSVAMFVAVLVVQLFNANPRLKRIHQGVLLWSGVVYLGFVLNFDLVQNAGWYLDWIVSTQLMLLAVLMSAGVTDDWVTGVVLVSQIVTILTGMMADLTGQLWWFGLGSLFAGVVLYQLWNIGWKSEGQRRWLLGWIFLFWVLYPAMWLAGTPGYGVLSPEVTSLLFVAVPLVSKTGLAVVDLVGPWSDATLV